MWTEKTQPRPLKGAARVTGQATPGILIGGAGNGGQATQLETNQIQQIYSNLLANGASAFSSTGSHTLVMTTGVIGLAGQIQSQAHLETPEVVQQNQQTLNAIGAYCRSHGIGIQIDAALTVDHGDQVVGQWIDAAASAGLPIVAVNDVQEIGLCAQQSPTPDTFNYAPYAANEVASVKAIIAGYQKIDPGYDISKMTVGDMEPNASTPWWATYNTAAVAAGVPCFTYVVQDMDWDVPWSYGSQWEDILKTMANATQHAGMALDLDFQGMTTTASGIQYVQQVEQHAAMLAASGVVVSNISLETWYVNPTTMTQVNSPDSVSNAAVEIAAILPLYSSGAINFNGTADITTRGQEVVTVGSSVTLSPLVLNANPSTSANGNVGVVLVDLYGALSATQFGHGTVTRLSDNALALTGNAADLTTELNSVKICELNSGPDSVNIQTFGMSGQIANTSMAILAVPEAAQGAIKLLPTVATQDWTAASAVVNATGTVVSETINWANDPAPASGGIGTVHTVAIHFPLAEYGVRSVNGVIEDVYNASTDYDQGIAKFANYPTQNGQARTFTAAFNAAANTIKATVLSTTMSFDPTSGNLQTVTSQLAPTSISYIDTQSGTLKADAFATQFTGGGSQVTEMNTGGNANWQAAWGNQFADTVLTYDSAGKLVEEFRQGGASNPSFTLDDVFDPKSGALWEEIQSNPQPSNYSNATTGTAFVTGTLDITQFNVAGNPNWEYSDWGSTASSDTQVWLDYYLQSNSSVTAPVPSAPIIPAPVIPAPVIPAPVIPVPDSAGGNVSPSPAVPNIRPSTIGVLDTSSNQPMNVVGQAYTGPVAGLQSEYIAITNDSLNIATLTPNWFIHSSGGNDAISVTSGTNVLDGGSGSNFLTGGSGVDTFFVDDRSAPADIWSTVNNFHAGDAATVWGVNANDFKLTWLDGQGAAGYTGLTLLATEAGKPSASLTLVNYSKADLADGRLSVSFGSNSDSSSYLYVHANG